MKKVFKIVLIVTIVAFLGLAITRGVRLFRYKKKAAATTIEAVDLSRVSDGIYQGEYDLDYVYVSLAVSVKAGLK